MEQRAFGYEDSDTSGTYHGFNLGDIAMLIVAVRRLKALWPKSQITVLTHEIAPFKRFVPMLISFLFRSEMRGWIGISR